MKAESRPGGMSSITYIAESLLVLLTFSLVCALNGYAQSTLFVEEGYLFEAPPVLMSVFPDDPPPEKHNGVQVAFVGTNLLSFSKNSFSFGRGQTVKDSVNSLITNLNSKLALARCSVVTNGITVIVPRKTGFRMVTGEYTINGNWSVGNYLNSFLGVLADASDSVLIKNENVFFIACKKDYETVIPLVVSGTIKNAIGLNDCRLTVEIEGINSSVVSSIVSPSGKYICVLDALVPQAAVQIGETIYTYKRPQHKDHKLKIELNGILVQELRVNVYTNQSYRINIDLGRVDK